MYVNMAIKNCQIYKGMFKSVDTILVNTRASPFIILLHCYNMAVKALKLPQEILRLPFKMDANDVSSQ